MLRELLAIFRGGSPPLEAMGEDFTRMLVLALENCVGAGRLYFGGNANAAKRSQIYETDIEINKLERKIRKRIAMHLIHANRTDVPHCLLLMSLIKDVERIGDYAKNIAEIGEIHPEELPSDDIFDELREIRRGVEESFNATHEIFTTEDRERALHYIQAGRDIAHRCDALIVRISKSDYPANLTTAAVLGARYYKRSGGHLLNIFSSVVMPLHKVDYYDEDEIEEPEKT